MMNSVFFTLLSFSLLINVSSLRLNHEGSSKDPKGFLYPTETSPVKLVFFAGVEGSGHHLLESITLELNRSDYHQEPKKKRPTLVQAHPFFTATKLKLPKGFWCGQDWKLKKEETLEKVVTQWKALKPGLYFLPQAMSYPACGLIPRIDGHGRRDLFHPQIDWLHDAAAEAGVKLHIILLNRPMQDCLAADCVHRQFQKCPTQTEVLETNSRFMLDQLQKIPKSDYSCFRYGDVKSMKSEVEQAFGMDSKGILETVYAEHPPDDQRANEPRWSELEARLRPISLEIEQACEAVESMSLSEFFL